MTMSTESSKKLSRINFSTYIGHVTIYLVECLLYYELFRVRVRITVWLANG